MLTVFGYYANLYRCIKNQLRTMHIRFDNIKLSQYPLYAVFTIDAFYFTLAAL